MAVRRRAHDDLGADIAGCARPVLDDKRLAKSLRNPLSQQTGEDVGRTASWERDDDAHRPRRISLRPRDPRDCRQRGCAGGQMQKLPSVGKFHGGPSRERHSSPRPTEVRRSLVECGDRRAYLARRYAVSVLTPTAEVVTSFSSSPDRLMTAFNSDPSALGIRAPSYRRIRVLSASLTDQVP